MQCRTVHPVAAFGGEILLPGDKSISQRVAILAALAMGTSEIRGFLTGADAMSTLHAVCALGASAVFKGSLLKITGTGGRFRQPANPLNMGNSGTGTRLLAGLLAGQPLHVIMEGDASLSRRPMGRIADPLKAMGAKLDLTGETGTLPMTVHGGGLRAIRYELPVASAQVKSCLLLAGLFAKGKTIVVEPHPTRDHTEKLFELFEIPLFIEGLTIELPGFGRGGPKIRARELTVPGDFSSAAFWITAAAVRPGAKLTVRGTGLNPRRTALLDVLRRMGAQIEVAPTSETDDPIGDIFVTGAELTGTEIAGDEISNLIDELPVLAVAGALAAGETVIRDAKELRVKESDRIAVMAENLRAFGIEVEEREDGMSVRGDAKLMAPAAVASRGDHRIAMSLAVLAGFAPGPVEIRDTACVDTSYPEFWSHLEQLGGKSE